MKAIEETCTPDVEFDWSRRLLDPIVVRGYDGVLVDRLRLRSCARLIG